MTKSVNELKMTQAVHNGLETIKQLRGEVEQLKRDSSPYELAVLGDCVKELRRELEDNRMILFDSHDRERDLEREKKHLLVTTMQLKTTIQVLKTKPKPTPEPLVFFKNRDTIPMEPPKPPEPPPTRKLCEDVRAPWWKGLIRLSV